MWRIIAILFALMLFSTLAEAQQVTRLCASTNSTQTNCVPITTTFGLTVGGTATVAAPTYSEGQVGAPLSFDLTGNLRVVGTASGTQDVNVAKINGVTPLMGNGVTGTGSQRVTIASDNTAFSVNAVLPTTGTIASGNGVVEAVSSEIGAGATSISSSTLAANLVVKGSAGNLYSFEVSADATLYTANWYILIYNATSAPIDGAVTPVKCYLIPAATSTFAAAFPHPVNFSTGITIGVSSTGCFTKTASIHAFISGDFK